MARVACATGEAPPPSTPGSGRDLTSAMGQTRRLRDVRDMSGLPQTADISGPGRHFAFVPKAEVEAHPVNSAVRIRVAFDEEFRRQLAATVDPTRAVSSNSAPSTTCAQQPDLPPARKAALEKLLPAENAGYRENAGKTATLSMESW